ncbi:hypothetical protein BJV74DRAFT_232865 [Russula compacta]|nr:hypothetical protein BJV74DRAFT_232865 [Russula compacta]
MTSKAIPQSRFLLHWSLLTRTFDLSPPPKIFFMRLPSSSSLILASLAVSSSSSSLSALAAPTSDYSEDSSSSVLVPLSSDDLAIYQQNKGIVGDISDIIAALPLPEALGSVIKEIIGLNAAPYDTKEARQELPPLVSDTLLAPLTSNLAPTGATRRAEESGANDLPQDPPTRPPLSEVPLPPAAAVSSDDNTKPPAAPGGNTPSLPLPALPVNPPVPPPPTVQSPTGLPTQPSLLNGAPGRRDPGVDVSKLPVVDEISLPLSPRDTPDAPVLPIVSGLLS